MSLLIAFISFTGVKTTQAMDDKQDDFKEVNLKKEGNESPKKSPKKETPPKETEKKKGLCTIL